MIDPAAAQHDDRLAEGTAAQPVHAQRKPLLTQQLQSDMPTPLGVSVRRRQRSRTSSRATTRTSCRTRSPLRGCATRALAETYTRLSCHDVPVYIRCLTWQNSSSFQAQHRASVPVAPSSRMPCRASASPNSAAACACLDPDTSRVPRCAPQVIHWLRLGCVPVGVLEGRPPPEKLEALRVRFRAHTGFEGGGGGGGAAAFQRLGGRVGAMLRAMVRAHSHVAALECHDTFAASRLLHAS